MDEETKRILDDYEKRIRVLEGIPKSDVKSGKKQISIKEFLLSKKPKDDVQRTLVVCYYLEKYKGMNIYNAKDVEDGFRDAKEKVPDNVNYKVIQNIKSGYMMEAKEKKDKFKAWTLTSTGERFVKNDLKKEK
ncbi:MAG: hypothetical protein AB1668_00685 [Nanoarchaeota archaeon]